MAQTNRGWDGTYSGFSRAVKQAAKKRDGHKCRQCQSTYRLEVDHVIPVSAGGSNDLDNAMTLCWDCHRRKTGAESGARLAEYNRTRQAKGKRPPEAHPSEGLRPQ